MSDHFISLNRGQSGFAAADFTIGTSSSPDSNVELRIADGANLTRNDVAMLVDQMRRFILVKGMQTVLPNAPV
jgi:hypothetical protein